MYALDNVRTASCTQYDLSDIPAHIITAIKRYEDAKALVSDYQPDLSTPAQKRTATMRFNKVCDLCDAAGIDAVSAMFRVVNQALSDRYK